MRAVRLAVPAKAHGVYAISALTDRLARMGSGETRLAVPPAEVPASWAGQQVPRGGWVQREVLEDDALIGEARRGHWRRRPGPAGERRQAGAHDGARPDLVIARGRHETQMPLAMAFGAQALGFLAAGERSTLFSSGAWLRLSCGGGHVVARQGGILG